MIDNKLIMELQEKIGYKFKDINLLKRAITHSSYSNEQGQPVGNYERLEYLGDAVLELVISDILFTKFSEKTEGELSKLRSNIVCENSLYSVGTELSLGKVMLLGKGEKATGGSTRPSIIADVVESLFGAIYLESGFDVVKVVVANLLEKQIVLAGDGLLFDDYKSALQEYFQSKSIIDINYDLVDTKGPDHDKEFTSELRVGGKAISKGIGKSKKASEQEAARLALIDIKNKRKK